MTARWRADTTVPVAYWATKPRRGQMQASISAQTQHLELRLERRGHSLVYVVSMQQIESHQRGWRSLVAYELNRARRLLRNISTRH